MYCGKCGNELTEIDRFCPKCGSPISNDTNISDNITNHSTIEKQDNIKGRKHNSTVIVVVSVLVIILMGVFAYKKLDNKPSNISKDINNTHTKSAGRTGIEQAIKDGMIGKDYITEGVTESKLKSAYYDGNLQFYYDSWEECLKDAKKLKILRTNEEI